MLRRSFLQGAAALSAQSRKPPNFVVVLCDDLGYGDLGCYGNRRIRTPHLDRFARQGLRFTDCYAASPVCSPSRAGLLTGRTPDRTGIYNWIPMDANPVHLVREEITIPRLLRQAGYATCLTGKWHLNGAIGQGQAEPSDHGFDHWFAAGAWADPSQKNPANFYRNGKPVGPLEGYASTLTMNESLAWLDRVGGAQPFFLMVAFHAPHEPVESAPRFVNFYRDTGHRGEREYFANVTELDHEFGRLLRYLDEKRLRDDTLVFFTSDNGPETLNRHPNAWRSWGSAGALRSRKLSLYEGGIRVPGIARWPGRIRPGTVSREPIASLDFLPTFCDAARVPRPARPLDGASLLPVFGGGAAQRECPLQWHYYNALDRPRSALRDGDWKILGIPRNPCPREPGGFPGPEDFTYIQNAELTEFELYNLARDPGERENLAAREPARLAALSARLRELHADVKRDLRRW